MDSDDLLRFVDGSIERIKKTIDIAKEFKKDTMDEDDFNFIDSFGEEGQFTIEELCRYLRLADGTTVGGTFPSLGYIARKIDTDEFEIPLEVVTKIKDFEHFLKGFSDPDNTQLRIWFSGLADIDISEDNLYIAFTHSDKSIVGPTVDEGYYRELRITVKGVHKIRYLSIGNNDLGHVKRFENLPYLKRLEIDNNGISKIENLEHLNNLEIFSASSNNIQKIENLSHLSKLRWLFLGYNSIPEIENLDNLVNLERLSLENNDINEIKNINHLTKLLELNLSGNKIQNVNGIENLVRLEELNISKNHLGIDCLEYLIRCRRDGYIPSLKKVNLKEVNIDWFNVKAGSLAWELKNLGIEIEGDDVHYVPPIRKETLQDYLHSKLDLADKYIDAIVYGFSPTNLSLLIQDSQVSANKVFHVETKDGRKLVVKLETNLEKARIEQSGNYFLSRDSEFSEFIIGSDVKIPQEFGGVYLVVQEDISDDPESKLQRPLTYYLQRMAKLHAKGIKTLEKEGVNIPNVRMRSYHELQNCLEQTEYQDFINISKLKIIRNKYEDSRAILKEGSKSLIL